MNLFVDVADQKLKETTGFSFSKAVSRMALFERIIFAMKTWLTATVNKHLEHKHTLIR